MKKKVFGAMLLCMSMLLFACGKKAEGETNSAITAKNSGDGILKEEAQREELQEERNQNQENPDNHGPSEEEESYIPETLLKFLGEQIGQENEKVIENISPLTIDQVLEEEELADYLDSPDVKECADRIEESNGIVLLIDGDNDGIDDLFVWIDDGGSMGNNSRVFLQGQQDGSFMKTHENEDITQELLFIEYEGRNYLLETTYDYYRKCVNGFRVSCYVDGIRREAANVYLENSHYEGNIVETDEAYRELAEKVTGMGESGFLEEYSYDWVLDAGNGEKEEELPEEWKAASGRERGYHSDINNDGKEEWYFKSIFYPSSLYAFMYLQDSLYLTESEEEELLTYYNLEWEGTPLAFWVEHVEETDKQIVCLLCYDGLSRNVVYGFLIEGETVTKVMEIDFKGNEKIAYDIYTYEEL